MSWENLEELLKNTAVDYIIDGDIAFEEYLSLAKRVNKDLFFKYSILYRALKRARIYYLALVYKIEENKEKFGERDYKKA